MDLKLTGRTALVTGGSRGIGFGVAQLLAAEGCHLHLASRNATTLDAARAKLTAEHGVNITVHALDLSTLENAAKLVAACGPVDILVNNAGAIPFGGLVEVDAQRWRESWNLKVFGTIDLTRAIYARMRERRSGVVINVIGVSGERLRADYLTGTTGNAGLMAFTRALGGESVDYGVRVVGVNPGKINTERMQMVLENQAEKLLGDRNRWPEMMKNAPLGRLGRPEEIADAVAFLASPRASYISGTIVTIDAGLAARNRD